MLRFTIRDVLFLTVVVGLAVALLLSNRQLGRVEANRKLWQDRANVLRDLMTGRESRVEEITFTDDQMEFTWKVNGH
jgi:hypothetical protein